jgi:exopolyphosphatase/guanosine-5'-triphosphate,3'-diphosphate pyrophosphatase
MAKITAVIDIGSNSVRMAVFKKTSHLGFVLLKEIKSRVRISEGAYENNGYLQEKAIQRALNALSEFSIIAKNLKANKILAVATSAVRDAPNKNQFLNLVKKQTGLKIKIIKGEEEALFGAISASNLLPHMSGITIDIGGGSTEFALIENRKIIDKISLNLGTVRLKELFFDKNDINGAIKYINAELEKLPNGFSNDILFGIGGTIRALSKVIMKKTDGALDILHGFTYNIKKEQEFLEKIIYSDYENLGKFGFKEERFDVIRQGVLILSEAIKKLNSKHLVTSGVGVREGVFLADLLRNHNYAFPHNFNPSVRSIEDIYKINKTNSNYETRLALELFDILKPIHNLDEVYKFHLRYAMKLSEAGNYIDFYSSHKHTNYVLLNSLNYGFTHKDRILISKIIRYQKKKKIKKEYVLKYGKLSPDKKTLEYLCQIFWLTKTLNTNLSKQKLEINFKNNTLFIKGENLYLTKEQIKEKKFPFEVMIEP